MQSLGQQVRAQVVVPAVRVGGLDWVAGLQLQPLAGVLGIWGGNKQMGTLREWGYRYWWFSKHHTLRSWLKFQWWLISCLVSYHEFNQEFKSKLVSLPFPSLRWWRMWNGRPFPGCSVVPCLLSWLNLCSSRAPVKVEWGHLKSNVSVVLLAALQPVGWAVAWHYSLSMVWGLWSVYCSAFWLRLHKNNHDHVLVSVNGFFQGVAFMWSWWF